jgi:hypothetical protein
MSIIVEIEPCSSSTQIIEKVIIALAQQGYSFDQVLSGAAEYAARRHDWKEVVAKLDAAADEVVRASRNIKRR